MLRVVWPPHVDYVKVVGPPDPAAHGFIMNGHRWWRPGWWAVEKALKGSGQLRTFADAEAAARTWPQPWGDEFHLTRVDVAADVVITGDGPKPSGPLGFTVEMRRLFAGRGRRTIEEAKDEMRTLYIGSRESPVCLRIYLKSKFCTERDKQRWLEHGWNGRDDVWRIEYEFHRRGLPANLELPRDTMALWNDGLRRIRMCVVPPRTYCEQNKCPTHPWWTALGNPHRLTRRAVDLAGPPKELTQREIMLALDRLCVRGGVAMLNKMLARLTRTVEVNGPRRRRRGNGESE